MKTFWRIAGLWIALVTVNVAGESRRPAVTPAAKPKTFCDPVCELRSQDAAFSLLVETFRQHQSYNIEIDYQYRVQAITEKQNDRSEFFIESNSDGLKMLRRLLHGLAKRERELRMSKLETQIENFQAAYSCALKIDEDYVGEKVPKNIDRRAAQATLKEFVIMTTGTLAQGAAAHSRNISASVSNLVTNESSVSQDPACERWSTLAQELQCPRHQQTARVMIDPLPLGGVEFEVFACCHDFEVRIQTLLEREAQRDTGMDYL